MTRIRLLLLGIMLTMNTPILFAQTELDERAVISFTKGIGFFAPDSAFGLNLRFRMQNRIGMNTISASNLSPEEFEANVRRLRLRFDGYLGKTGLTYYLQLSFSRGDQDWDASGFPGIVRDAMVFYTFSDRFYIGMGQGKLPGNRQRVISSGQQQFADRSLVNAIFTIDRDFGMMAYYNNAIGRINYGFKGAISSGEGRNIQKTDNGLAYTARFELLPLGNFEKDGDFSEGDLARESSPKISMGTTYSFNHKAVRASGQRGTYLASPTDIHSYFIDIIAKYNGWAFQSEYAKRNSNNKAYLSGEVSNGLIYVVTGHGINAQLSYVFTNLVEIAGRYTYVQPNSDLSNLEPKQQIITAGITKYMPNHRNKLQLNLSHQKKDLPMQSSTSYWNVMMQVEVGI